jgi:type I restriction enzyme S subunit
MLVREVPEKAVFASYLIRFRPGASVDAGYLAYFLQSPEYWRSITERASGIAMPNVNAKKLASIQIPIPPRDVQTGIVAKLDELFSDLDAGVVALERAKANVARYRAAVLKAAVAGKLTEQWRREHPNVEPVSELLSRVLAGRPGHPNRGFRWKRGSESHASGETASWVGELGVAWQLPDSWRWEKLYNLCEVFSDCPHRTPKYSNDGRPALRPRDVVGGILDIASAWRVSDAEFKSQT